MESLANSSSKQHGEIADLRRQLADVSTRAARQAKDLTDKNAQCAYLRHELDDRNSQIVKLRAERTFGEIARLRDIIDHEQKVNAVLRGDQSILTRRINELMDTLKTLAVRTSVEWSTVRNVVHTQIDLSGELIHQIGDKASLVDHVVSQMRSHLRNYLGLPR